MIKKHIRNCYRQAIESDADFEVFFFHYRIGLILEYFINRRILAYLLLWLSLLLVWLFVDQQKNPASATEWIVATFVGVILALLAVCFIIKYIENNSEKILKTYTDNTKKLHDFFLKFFTLFHNKIISIKDWKKIKSISKNFYLDVTSDECDHLCYYYSLKLALMLKDVDLIWGSVYCPVSRHCCAHAFIVKNGYVYDSNSRLCYKFDNYKKFGKLNIYKTWSYEEYSIPNFRLTVREDFRKWCDENNVVEYSRF